MANHNALFLESRAAGGGEGASSVVGVTLQVGVRGRVRCSWRVARRAACVSAPSRGGRCSADGVGVVAHVAEREVARGPAVGRGGRHVDLQLGGEHVHVARGTQAGHVGPRSSGGGRSNAGGVGGVSPVLYGL